MEIQEYLKEMKSFYEVFQQFLDDEKDNFEQMYQNLVQKIKDEKILENQHKLKSVINFVSKFTLNHHRCTMYNAKLERFFSLIKDPLKKNFTDEEIIKLFAENKRILLILIDQHIIDINDKNVYLILNNDLYFYHFSDYLFPEFKPFLTERTIKRITEEFPENFEEKRRNGENEDLTCQLIRKDAFDEFIIHQNKIELNLDSTVSSSIFETNPFLMGKNPSLIEYAAFYGSIKIFNYLKLNKIKLTTSLWLYAIHGNNPEIIQILIDEKIKPPVLEKIDHSIEGVSKMKFNFNQNNEEEEEEEEKEDESSFSYVLCLLEAIKCHHNQIVNFFRDNYNNFESINFLNLFLESYNFFFLTKDDLIKENFYKLCIYDYYIPVEYFVLSNEVDINALTI